MAEKRVESYEIHVREDEQSQKTKSQANTIPHPPIVSEDEWLAHRLELLHREKELTKLYDTVNTERRRLPMVRVEQKYEFESSSGKKSLWDLFDGRRQLIIYHFMFDPDWADGCPSCTGYVNALGDLSLLANHDTTFALVSRAPYRKLDHYRKKMGWELAWYSSYGTVFNYDFHTTLDKNIVPVEYNYKGEEELTALMHSQPAGEMPGISVFFRLGKRVFHTYSAYARGVENVTNAFELLDITPYGRQQDFENSPPGWPQSPTYG